jgi:hypothetical protein
MTIRIWRGVAVVLVGLTVPVAGCVGRLVGEGAEGVFGPKGAYFELEPVAPDKETKALKEYRRFELGEITNEVDDFVPQEFFDTLPGAFAERLTEQKLPDDPAGPTLVMPLTIIHYETAEAADNIFGPLEQVVARVQLIDQASGRVLARGNAVGRTDKTIGLGAESKAKGLAKGLVRWITDYYPEPDDGKSGDD